jgi:uncharacterized membrane protein YjfL (UPF0719 family)
MESIDVASLILDLSAGIIYLVVCFVLFIIAKFTYHLLNTRINSTEELVKKDNAAFAVAMAGYYFGVIMAIGGALVGPNNWFLEEPFDLVENIRILSQHVLDIFFYGILSIVLMNLSVIINDKVILYKFRNEDEIIRDQNAGTGAVEFASYTATGLIVFGAVSGDTTLVTNLYIWRYELGGLFSALIFWILGQGVMVLAGVVYNAILPFDVHKEIEKDNVAAGIGFAGVLLALGNLIRVASMGNFISWQENILRFTYIVILGLVLLPVIRFGTDKILLPGEKLTDEIVNQEKPNIGAAFIEAMSYVGASFLIGWAI